MQNESIEQSGLAPVILPDGAELPRLGQGTWHMAEQPARRPGEIEALRRGIACGLTLIDTAEMYADGAAESLVGAAIKGLARDRLTIVSKVYPHHAGRRDIFRCCDQSLRRLGIERLDLYLLHWRGRIPLSETVACMEQLVEQGKIARWGVSNFDVADLEALWRVPGGNRCQVNQVLYHLGSRGIEFDLLPWQRRHGLPVMAYCPLGQGGQSSASLLQNPRLKAIAIRNRATPAQIALHFLLYDPLVIPIPKAANSDHVAENAAAARINLDAADLKELDAVFPAPRHKIPLDMR
jgi:diketogulonate reductase-like aldo/keto reductase